MAIFQYMCLILAAAIMVYAAASDFKYWKIPNWTILSIVGIYIVLKLYQYLFGVSTYENTFLVGNVGSDIAAALLLFTLGVILWLLKMFGAGDAKLFFPIGLFIGWVGLMPFAILLLVLGIVAAIILKLPMPLQLQFYWFFTRLDEIRKTKKVPYGVIMVGAALATMGLRLQAGL